MVVAGSDGSDCGGSRWWWQRVVIGGGNVHVVLKKNC